jgi:prevent-host-death family protein
MERVGAYDAKTHLSKLLDRVSLGETILITKHGIPVAELRPPVGSNHLSPAQAIAELKDFRRKNTLNGIKLRDLIDEGRS